MTANLSATNHASTSADGATALGPRAYRTRPGGRTITVGVVGATGYAGGELVRLLLAHPRVKLAGLYGRNRDHEPIGVSHPQLRPRAASTIDQAIARGRRRLHRPAPRRRRGDGRRDRGERLRAARHRSGLPAPRSGRLSALVQVRPPGARTSWPRPSTACPSSTAPRSRAAAEQDRHDHRPAGLLPHGHDPDPRAARPGRPDRRSRGRRQERRLRRGARPQAGHALLRGQRERQGLRHVHPPPHRRDGAGAAAAGRARLVRQRATPTRAWPRWTSCRT